MPSMVAGMVLPTVTAYNLNPVIKNSLVKITITIHAGINLNSTNDINAPEIKILSANGSKKAPNLVEIFLFLAILPSKKSVKEAKENIINAINFEAFMGKNKKIKKKIVRTILEIVKMLGRFSEEIIF